MNIFWILISLVMVVLGILTLVAILCILWFGRKRSWRFRLAWVGFSCFPMVCFFWFVGWFSAYEPSDPEELARGFEFELHHPLPIEVSDLRIKRTGIGDGVGSRVRFEATPDVVDTLIKSFSACDKATFDELGGGANGPEWWDPDEHQLVAFYHAEHWEPGCDTFSHAVLAHDAAKRIVYFAHSGS
jgi:4-amino-4-deoxy-L-arabinose transferase-like glycosyltransferase